MIEVQKLNQKRERAILVAVQGGRQSREKTIEYLDELEFLASTIKITTEARFIQALDTPDKRTFIGKGKLEEVFERVQADNIDVVIFDDDLSPSQVRNLENELKIKIYDRSLLILDIFLFRAQTAQAKTQVELARSQYLLPRLTRMWTHLERQRGGTGTRGGAGEKEIETDRRMLRDKITRLKRKLEKIDVQNATQRKGRNQLVRVALVGYTNVGKSTIMRLISKSEVFAENKLFATVDSTVRKVVIQHIPFLLSDTVGFIRKLPTTLIECFKSTLDEVREADLLLHVIDVSHPSYEEHLDVVNQTLVEIGAHNKPIIHVFNKVDQFQDPELEEPIEDPVAHLEHSHLKTHDNAVFISATNKTNIDTLKRKMFDLVSDKHYTIYPNFYRMEYFEGYDSDGSEKE